MKTNLIDEPTTLRKRQRTIEGVFNESPAASKLAQLVQPVANVPVTLPAQKHEVVPYGARPPVPLQTLDVRMRQAIVDELAPLRAQIEVQQQYIKALEQGQVKAAKIIASAIVKVHEGSNEIVRVGKDVVTVGTPLAKRALELEAEKMKRAKLVAAGRTFWEAMWDNREILAGAILTASAFFCVASMVYYLLHH